MSNGVSSSDEREAAQLLGIVVVLLLLVAAPSLLATLEHLGTDLLAWLVRSGSL